MSGRSIILCANLFEEESINKMEKVVQMLLLFSLVCLRYLRKMRYHSTFLGGGGRVHSKLSCSPPSPGGVEKGEGVADSHIRDGNARRNFSEKLRGTKILFCGCGSNFFHPLEVPIRGIHCMIVTVFSSLLRRVLLKLPLWTFTRYDTLPYALYTGVLPPPLGVPPEKRNIFLTPIRSGNIQHKKTSPWISQQLIHS